MRCILQHPGQKVAAMTVAIVAREGSSEAPGPIAPNHRTLRDKQGTYSNLDGARCVD